MPPDYGPSYLKPPLPGSPLPPFSATASSFTTPSDGGGWGSTPFPIWGIIAPAIPVAILLVLAGTAFIRRRSRRAAMIRQQQQQQQQATRQGQSTGQHGAEGGPGGAEEGLGGEPASGGEAVVVDAAFEALVAGLPAECDVPPVFLCPITQVGEGAGAGAGCGLRQSGCRALRV